jgi:Holliday junction DNA helicase RuvA
MMISVSATVEVAIEYSFGHFVGRTPRAISGGEVARPVAIPGIGRKMAERLILELKEKAAKKMAADTVAGADARRKESEALREDVLSALVNLGYKANAARDALDRVIRDAQDEPAMDQLLKKALKILAG